MKKGKKIGMMIKQINDALEKRANNALRENDMTFSQNVMLTMIYEAPGKELTLKELEQKLHVAQPTAYGTAKRLEEKKLITTFSDAQNKRVKHAGITKAGEAQYHLGEKHMREADRLLSKNLTADEKKQLLALLTKVQEGIE